MNSENKGFTLTELVVVLGLVGLIAAIAVPNYLSLERKTRVMQAVADLQAVRAAAFIYYGDTMSWPKETPPGTMPPELAERLPAGFAFASPEYVLDWDNWYTVRGKLRFPDTGIGIGIGLVSEDSRLVLGIQQVLTGAPLVQISSIKTSLRIAGAEGI